ncbi:MAG TPA: hypothetical protein VK400_03675 [Pyrinomonadaceae bacterium]|nr:hypothetical protein [Pyrinomonadaceae bacterium]
MKSGDLNQLPDQELLAAVRLMNNNATGVEASYGLTSAMTAGLKAELDGFEDELATLDAARAAEAAAVGTKNQRREQIIGLARKFMTLIRGTVGNDAGKLGAVNLDALDETRTKAGAPVSVPFALIDLGKLRHTVNFRDAATPDTDKKPAGILGAEIWYKIGGAAPVDNKECQFLALDTATPYVVTFDGADAGKTVYYLLRWQSKSGDKGDWSDLAQATVNG